MDYLKCTQCGYLNEVDDINLSTCKGCNKKLDNNFLDWQTNNPDKTYEDFKRLNFISDNQSQMINESASIKKKKRNNSTFATVVIIILCLFLSQIGKKIIGCFNNEKRSKQVLAQQWVITTNDDYGFSIETPTPLIKTELPDSDAIRKQISKRINKMISLVLDDKIFVYVFNAIFHPSIGSLNFQTEVDNAIYSMKMIKGVSNVVYSGQAIYKGNIPGVLLTGSFNLDGIKFEFSQIIFLSRLYEWQIHLSYRANDDLGRLTAKRIIDSIRIKI